MRFPCRLCNDKSDCRTIVTHNTQWCKTCYLWRKSYRRSCEDLVLKRKYKRGRPGRPPAARWVFNPWTGERIEDFPEGEL